MTFKLVKSIQQATDLRLIMPFGLQLSLGDVVSVGRDGGFTLEGTSRSLLGVLPGRVAQGDPAGEVDLMQTAGDGTTCQLRAAGEASTLFPNLPQASVRFDIAFGSESGWLLAYVGRSIKALKEVNRFRQPILDAYSRGVWKPDWAVVTSVATVERMTLLAARNRNTRLALTAKGRVKDAGGLSALLTAGVSIVQLNHEILKCVTTRRTAVACAALRVQDPWWGVASVGNLGSTQRGDLLRADDAEFWEDVDVL